MVYAQGSNVECQEGWWRSPRYPTKYAGLDRVLTINAKHEEVRMCRKHLQLNWFVLVNKIKGIYDCRPEHFLENDQRSVGVIYSEYD
jgi:hypothetical protein